jgi:hypothetical protein
MCPTCDFEFPGHFHLCPACATSAHKDLSPRRKKLLIISYALAGWATLALALMFSGVFAEVVDSEAAVRAFEMLIGIVIFLPTIAGAAVSFSALDKKLGNPPAIWGAVIWNGLLLAVWVLLTVVGSLM